MYATLSLDELANTTSYEEIRFPSHEFADGESVSDRDESSTVTLDEFDENVAALIVASIHRRDSKWTLRATGNVVLDVLDRSPRLMRSPSPMPVRELVSRAHRIARQIVPASRWSGV